MIRTTIHLKLPRPDPIFAVAAFWFALLLIVCAAVGLTTPAEPSAPAKTMDVVYVVATPTSAPIDWAAAAVAVKRAPEPTPEPEPPRVEYQVVYVPVEAPASETILPPPPTVAPVGGNNLCGGRTCPPPPVGRP